MPGWLLALWRTPGHGSSSPLQELGEMPCKAPQVQTSKVCGLVASGHQKRQDSPCILTAPGLVPDGTTRDAKIRNKTRAERKQQTATASPRRGSSKEQPRARATTPGSRPAPSKLVSIPNRGSPSRKDPAICHFRQTARPGPVTANSALHLLGSLKVTLVRVPVWRRTPSPHSLQPGQLVGGMPGTWA